MKSIAQESLVERMRFLIKESYLILTAKISSGSIKINKEASMQLHYSNILLKLSEIYQIRSDEKFEIILEAGVKIDSSVHERLKKGNFPEIDLIFSGTNLSNGEVYNIAVEMKFYKKYSSSGKLRGASNLFMRDVYTDIEMLELYQQHLDKEGSRIKQIHEGFFIAGTDFEYFTKKPNDKKANCWLCDTSDGAIIKKNEEIVSEHTENKEKVIYNYKFSQNYEFKWDTLENKTKAELENDNFYFCLLNSNLTKSAA